MNLEHLTSFLAVASTGSLTAAARTLFITQPAISHHIKGLEDQLGIQLFVRHKKGMMLTAEGEELRSACQDVIRAAEDVSFQVQQINHLKKGRIVLTLTSFLSNALTPAVLAFKKEYPGIHISLIFNNTDHVVSCIKNNQADIGFACTVAPASSSVASGLVHSEQLLLVAGAGHPLTGKESVSPDDLRDYLFVTREVGTFTRQHTEQWFGSATLPANTIETTRSESVRNLIFAGAVGIMPENSVREDITEGKLRALPAKGLQSWVDCSAYISTARPLSKAALTFLHIAQKKRCFSRPDQLQSWLESLG